MFQNLIGKLVKFECENFTRMEWYLPLAVSGIITLIVIIEILELAR